MIKLSLRAYVIFLVNRYRSENAVVEEVTFSDKHSHRWFGLLPFLWKWFIIGQKK